MCSNSRFDFAYRWPGCWPGTPAAFKALIAERGWRMADLACRWAIRPEHLSRIAADAARDTKWDDGVRALPTLSPRKQAAVTAARRQLMPNPPRLRPMKPGDVAAGATAPEHGRPACPTAV